jgi:hypothetical protein
MRYSILKEIKKIVKEAKQYKTPPLPFSFWGQIKRATGTLTMTKNDNSNSRAHR